MSKSSGDESAGKTDAAAKKKNHAAMRVAMRNRFYYLYYRKISLIFLVSMGLCGFSLASAFYFATKETPPIYIPINSERKLVETYPLDKPSYPDLKIMEAEVQSWALEGARRIFSYDYLNYSEQMSSGQSYFTVRGWNKYLKSLEQSQNLNTVLKQQMIVNFVPMGPPQILESKIIEGRLAWAVEIPAKIQYIAHTESRAGFEQIGKVRLVLLRISLVDSPKGIGIDQVIFEETAK